MILDLSLAKTAKNSNLLYEWLIIGNLVMVFECRNMQPGFLPSKTLKLFFCSTTHPTLIHNARALLWLHSFPVLLSEFARNEADL